ncbi:hypothetical protein CI109_106234 [Kwoniella shandongensis]|uniref:Uncharacterized protein n=1 Tax=Kwoniella shandongensis TaxID=1734106 RepID=A0A5M6BYE1_9TREE|nr:uncharacterized protein CI109_003838 [Kwoniella shandongensis]KAA5527866.1 hypothetical protein CI109_003838 [Kwoniella shandongensis]
MPALPAFLQRRPKDPVPPPPITTYYLSSPPTAPYPNLRPIPPPNTPRPLPTSTLIFSLTHPHPSSSPETAFFLSCLPDPIGFLYHSATFISKHLSLNAEQGLTDWRHQLIELALEDKDGLAATSGGKIGVSLKWVGDVMRTVERGERGVDGAIKEFKGVLLHELVHTIQHDGHGSTPGWLIESIADNVRLLAHLDPPHWRRSGAGNKEKGWEAAYDVGARFLVWLTGVEISPSAGQTQAAIPVVDRSETPRPIPTSTTSTAPAAMATQYPLPSVNAPPQAPLPSPGKSRPGPYPDLVRLIDARLKYDRWSESWWEEMTGLSLEKLWEKYLEYYS